MFQLKVAGVVLAGGLLLALGISSVALLSQRTPREGQQVVRDAAVPVLVWSEPSVQAADLEQAGVASADLITERTDFTRKVVTIAPGAGRAAVEQAVVTAGGTVVGEAGVAGLVVSLPADNLVAAETELTESSAVQNVETDFAVSLLANPDWGVVRVKAPDVWEIADGGGVSIAVLDTGLDRGHPEFSGAYLGGYDFFNDDDDPEDDHGHGTAVAGIALARQNGAGTIGVGKSASVLTGKVLGSDGVGYISTVVSGIDWAVEQGARVINLSLGTTFDSETLKAAVDRAAAREVVVIAAAGNTGGGPVIYPAAYDSVIAVGATDRSDALASFSAVGSELVAPGVSVQAPWPGGGYASISGTSASAPHVSALAALLLQHGTDSVRQALRDGADDLGTPGLDPYFGYGLPEAPAALALTTEDSTRPTVSFIEPRDGQKISGQVVIRVDAADDRGVVKVDLIAPAGMIISASATPPYRWRWNVQDTPPGTYVIIARAYDEAGNVGEDRVTVEVIIQASLEHGQQEQDSATSSPKPMPTVGIQPLVSPRSTTSPVFGTSGQESTPGEPGESKSGEESSGPPPTTIEKIPPQAGRP